MDQVETYCYIVAAVLQLAALVFAAKMAREVSDRRPWLFLSAALFIMFAYRVVASLISAGARQKAGPFLSISISFLLFVSLFYIRRIAVAERESRAVAKLRTAERDESDKRYQSLVELSPDVMFVNAGDKIVYANAAALHFFGAKSSEELLGRSPLDFIAAESRELVQSRIRNLNTIGQIQPVVPEEWLRLDGSRVPVEAVAAYVPWKGGAGIQVILRDISERKKAEEEKSQLLAGERAARSVAEHASRMKDEFLATLSHELRTPLNAILGWSQLLRRQDRGDHQEIEEGLSVIERNARMQTRLIEDLLDMSRIISGKLRLEIQRVIPITMLEAAIATVKPGAELKGIRLEQVLDPLAGPIAGDPNRLQQIVWNLLSNAIKFTPRGGKIQIALERVNSHIEISVADTGQGIRADFLPYVFDRFRQADGSTTRAQGGLGLGLAIVKQLVELHGGSVQVKSPGEGQGTTFIVQLPLSVILLHKDDGPRLHPQTHLAPNGTHLATSLEGLKVLVVDDEPDALHLIQRVLEECQAKVIITESADLAQDILRLERPDVVISDIGMPGKDGYQFIHDVRALSDERGGRTPAIALTAFARSEDRTRAMMAGYQVHLSKPIEPEELVATVASLAGRTGKS
jgi:PAS domain S-box-containing protein